MSESLPKFAHMCKGPNDDMAAAHQEKADYHAMMARFYRLDRERQIAVMAYFDALAAKQKETQQ